MEKTPKVRKIIIVVFLSAIVIAFLIFMANKFSNEQIVLREREAESEGATRLSESAVRNHNRRIFVRKGAVNVTDALNVRNASNAGGEIIRTAAFGEHFYLFDTAGTGEVENGIMDLWYKVSETGDEWVNALHLRTLPFTIASDEKISAFDDQFCRSAVYMNVLAINGRNELRVEIYFAPNYSLNNEETVPLRKEYILGGEADSKYSLRLFENSYVPLSNYGQEIKKLKEMASLNRARGAVFEDSRLNLGRSYFTAVNSPDVDIRNGVKVGNTSRDIFAQFGDTGYEEFGRGDEYKVIVYKWADIYAYMYRLEFALSEDETINRITMLYFRY